MNNKEIKELNKEQLQQILTKLLSYGYSDCISEDIDYIVKDEKITTCSMKNISFEFTKMKQDISMNTPVSFSIDESIEYDDNKELESNVFDVIKEHAQELTECMDTLALKAMMLSLETGQEHVIKEVESNGFMNNTYKVINIETPLDDNKRKIFSELIEKELNK